MENLKIVNQVIENLEKRNFDKVETYLTDNFTYGGSVPKTLDKKEWIGMQKTLQTGFPDLKLKVDQAVEKGKDKVIGKLIVSGTHSADLPSLLPGMKAIHTTGKKITMPAEEFEFTFSGDKVSALKMKPVSHGGVMGIVEQLQSATPGNVKHTDVKSTSVKM